MQALMSVTRKFLSVSVKQSKVFVVLQVTLMLVIMNTSSFGSLRLAVLLLKKLLSLYGSMVDRAPVSSKLFRKNGIAHRSPPLIPKVQ